MEEILVYNANKHNLDHVSLTLPRDKLIVFTGVSGSGKSSLAFDTIFAEGQRRYVESLSSYARQFIGQFEKPEVEAIDGLSPAISIDQKTASRSPRSTVGTVTEIYDFLRVLYARIGIAHCPVCHAEVTAQSAERIVERIWAWEEKSKLQILSPVVRGRKGDYNALFQQFRKEGFVRVRIDGEIHLLEELEDDFRLERNKVHKIDVVMDRIILRHDDLVRNRLGEAVQSAIKRSDGYVIVQRLGEEPYEQFFSSHLACPNGHELGGSDAIGLDEMAPRMFSFNSPYGACPDCEGLGIQYEIAEALLIPNPNKTLVEGAIAPFEKSTGRYYQAFLRKLAKKFGVRIETPYTQLNEAERRLLLHGERPEEGKILLEDGIQDEVILSESEDDYDWFDFVSDFDGIINILRRRYLYGSDATKNYIQTFMQEKTCVICQGSRLKPLPLSVKLGGKNIDELTRLPLADALPFIEQLPDTLTDFQKTVGQQALSETQSRLRFLLDVGLGYLSLSRSSNTLSGGESQRIRLATQLGAGLSGILYVLDEPSIGLHQHNNRQLIQTLCRLRDIGNSLIVVEHDEETIRAADWVVDIGPGAGVHGGHVVAEGTVQQIEKNPSSLTGHYLSGQQKIVCPTQRRSGSGNNLTLRKVTQHNLKGMDVHFPLGKLICVTGLSGSGKSTLVFGLLYNALRYHFRKHLAKPQGVQSLEGLEHIDKFIHIDQKPIGRSPRSNPITYTGIFDDIRKVFASTEDAKIRGYNAGRFSFNVKVGRCAECAGAGYKTLEMNFLPDVHIHCDQCEGKRYNPDTLDVKYREKNIADVLAMTVEEACDYFQAQQKIYRHLNTLRDVGLEYITLGQPATTLSGGEAQRLKLATEFMKRNTGKTLYLLDEPTVGLHWKDLENLILILNRLVEQGNTVIVIEHNLDLIKVADHLIDMGPEGGEAGGYIVAEGTPEEVANVTHSYTGHFLKTVLAL